MKRNTSVTLGNHFLNFIQGRIELGRFDNTSEAVRAGLRLLEAEEAKLDILRRRLQEGVDQIKNGETVDGEAFMDKLLSDLKT